ncbi:MAG: hypothetical protein L0338_39645 [Acidobacteria bacterium]|nr:hypothetical protein [Acidobacteriota bacterium]
MIGQVKEERLKNGGLALEIHLKPEPQDTPAEWKRITERVEKSLPTLRFTRDGEILILSLHFQPVEEAEFDVNNISREELLKELDAVSPARVRNNLNY